MKIEAGKCYRTRDGQKVGPLRKGAYSSGSHPFDVDHLTHKVPSPYGGMLWDAQGKAYDAPQFDLIAEWTDTPDLTTLTTPFGLLDRETQEALRAHGGPYELWRGSLWGDVDPHDFFDGWYSYRVKPKPAAPREWWAVGLHLHNDEAAARTFLDELNDAHPEMDFGPIIHVREVLPE